MNAPTIVPDISGVVDVQRFAQHVYTCLPMSMETGTEAHPMADNTSSDNDLEAWRLLVQRLDPASAQANLNTMGNMLKPVRSKIDNISFLIPNWDTWCADKTGEQVWRRRRTIRRGPTLWTCAVSEWSGACCLSLTGATRIRRQIRDYMEQMRHVPHPMDIDGMAHHSEEEHDGSWENGHAVGCTKGETKGRGKIKHKGQWRLEKNR